jgi:hypothetical protein
MYAFAGWVSFRMNCYHSVKPTHIRHGQRHSYYSFMKQFHKQLRFKARHTRGFPSQVQTLSIFFLRLLLPFARFQRFSH